MSFKQDPFNFKPTKINSKPAKKKSNHKLFSSKPTKSQSKFAKQLTGLSWRGRARRCSSAQPFPIAAPNVSFIEFLFLIDSLQA